MAITVQYYDVVLAIIAASLIAGAIVGYATTVALPIAIVVAGGLALAFVGHALFVNGPVDEIEDLSEEVPLEEVPATLSPLESASE